MFRIFRPQAVLCLLVFSTAMTTQSGAKTANADKMNARFEKLADASIGRRLGRSHPICAIERVRSKRRRGAGVGWSLVYGCNRKARDGSRKRFSLQAVAEINSFTFDHPRIAIRHRRDFKKNSEHKGGTNNIDTRRTRWKETDRYTARLKERIIAWGLPRKSDSHSATVVADGKKRFTGLRKDSNPRPDNSPLALRVTVKVKMGYDKMASLRADAGKVAMQIADDIWNGIAGAKDVCDRVDRLPVTRQSKSILKYLCKNNIVLSLKFNRPPLRLAGYVKDEDGTVPAIRTNFETALFRELKQRLIARKAGQKKLRPQSLFWLTVRKINSIEQNRSSKRRYPVIAFEALLTAHNVTRLLARPEQWIGKYPYNAYGADRTIVDSASPLLEDLVGRDSVDGRPTFYARYKMRQRDPYPVFDRFFNESGPFYFHAPARRALDARVNEPDGFNYPSHFNAGIHYYFWVGAIVKNVATNMAGGSSRFGSVAQWATYFYELTQKKYATRNPSRGRIQLDNGFTKGAEWWGRLSASLEELKEHAPARVRP